MVRWEPGAKERLQAAALALFVERGYEQTTVQDIAAAAGLTERTFFRHFADKREVLFHGQDAFEGTFLEGAAGAAPEATAFEVASAAILAAPAFFPDERRPWSTRRQIVLDANPALLERELLKRATLANALTAAIVDRGLPVSDARIAAETAVTAFFIAFRLWIGDGEERSLLELEHDVLARMTLLAPAAPSA